MTKWEYAVWYDCDEESLNKRGKDGWELVAVVNRSTDFIRMVYFFKRPRG